MYSIFDIFLADNNWHRMQGSEVFTFYKSLRSIIHSEGFNADEMGEYMRQKLGLSRGRHEDELFCARIDYLITVADGIHEYLICSKDDDEGKSVTLECK